MTSSDLDEQLSSKESLFPELFKHFRAGGWSETWRARPSEVEREPVDWVVPFPMHELARAILERFLGRQFRTVDVHFGTSHHCTAKSLQVIKPYEVEEYLLGERPPTKSRPPAFPVCMSNSFVMFLREDWSTVMVSYCWAEFVVVDNLFEILNAFTTHTSPFLRDTTLWTLITEPSQVPDRVQKTIYLTP